MTNYGPERDCVITIPANYTKTQHEHTKRAIKWAGLNYIEFLAEPIAAAISEGL